MSTGDLNGNLQRLLRELKAIKCPGDIDEVGLRLGDPVAFLPLLNFTLLKFSRHVARFIVRHGFELAGKTDHRFVESCFKLFRDVFSVRTVLTQAQFFEQGYAERKVLLLCDVIAVCKKLHNEEVRHERLATLKANRQDQVSSRLAAPRRTSPHVKVVRNDDMEIQQVLAPQHLPNASDASQSVYKTKKIVAMSRSPSPSPSVQPAAGKAAIRQQQPSPLSAGPLPSSKGANLELTFRPLAPANAGPAQRQAPASSAAPVPPIHTWFMNPAFTEGEEGNADWGSGGGFAFGASGRPDSSAWWRLASSPQEQQAAPPSQRGGASAAANRLDVTDGSLAGAAVSGRHLFFGRQPAVAATTAAAQVPPAGLHQGVLKQHSQKQNGAAAQQPHHQAAVMAARKGGSDGAAAAPSAAAGGSSTGAAAGSLHGFPRRDLDEWSFSKYFGPGKVALGRRGGNGTDDDTDDSSQHAGDAGERDAMGAQGEGRDDLERDGPASDQDRRSPARSSPAGRPAAPPALQVSSGDASHGAGLSLACQQQRQQTVPDTATAANGAAAASGASPADRHGRFGAPVDWQAQLAQLERETQQQVQQLQDKLAFAEQELEKTRVEARQSREALQARVTVLEGRVRFLECELELCTKRPPGQDHSLAGSPRRGHAGSPPAPGALAAEPSLTWNSSERPHSAGRAGPQRQREPSPLPRRAAAAPQHGGSGQAAAAAAPGYRGPDAPADTAQTRPNLTSTAAPGIAGSGLTSGEQSRVREAAPGATGEGVGLRWDTRPGPASSAGSGNAYSLHLSYSTAGRVAAQPGLSAVGSAAGRENLAQARLPAAAQQPSALNGSAGSYGHCAPVSVSPMPQPSFSFQPSSLMQQVASAAAPPHQQPLPQSLHLAGRPAAAVSFPAGLGVSFGCGSRPLSADLNDALTSANRANAVPDTGDFGPGPVGFYRESDGGSVRVTAAYMRSSLDAGLRLPAAGGMADLVPAQAAAGGTAAAGADAYQHQTAWRDPERVTSRAALPASILDRAPAAAGAREGAAGELLAGGWREGPLQLAGATSDEAHGSWQQQGQQQHYAAAPAELPRVHAPSSRLTPALSLDAAGTAANVAEQVVPCSAGGIAASGVDGSAVPGTVAAGGAGGSRDTGDVINSLFLRYTEAQDFLQSLRKR